MLVRFNFHKKLQDRKFQIFYTYGASRGRGREEIGLINSVDKKRLGGGCGAFG